MTLNLTELVWRLHLAAQRDVLLAVGEQLVVLVLQHLIVAVDLALLGGDVGIAGELGVDSASRSPWSCALLACASAATVRLRLSACIDCSDR